jgi:hypothetical protein
VEKLAMAAAPLGLIALQFGRGSLVVNSTFETNALVLVGSVLALLIVVKEVD